MTYEKLQGRYKTVCNAPSGNGFHVDHMPQFLLNSDIDDSSPHVHAFYEILWFQDGDGIHTIDFTSYPVVPNTIFFISPGQVHHFDGIRNYRGVAIKLCTDFMRDEESLGNLFLKYNAFHTFDALPYYRVDDATAQLLAALVGQMEEESACFGQFGNVDVLKSLLRIFLVMVQRHGVHVGEERLDELKPQHRLFVQFRRLVEQHYTRLHTVQEYADALNTSVRNLNKSVNECAHTSPLAFINERIMLEAKRLVRYSNMMIKEIAFELGFDDPSYFVKLFKRSTGYLPSDFRDLDHVIHCRLDLNEPCQ